jgi:tripartite-type tricarboxylate transporter receptor subunit TctC
MDKRSTRNVGAIRAGLVFALTATFAAACAEVEPTPAGTTAGGTTQATAAAPEGYPERPVELNVVYPAGGGMDVTARALAAAAKEVSGEEYRVVNREGAGGLVGHTYLAKQAKPDGYELGVVAVDFLVFDVTLRKAQFGKEDFAPLAYVAFEPVVQVVRAKSDLGKKDFGQIVEEAKANPGKLRIGVVPNTTFDVFTQVVSKQTGAEFTKVPFDGGKPGVTALLGGDIDITNAFYPEVEAYIKSGDLVPVAISDNTAHEAMPDVPTMKELGIDVPDRTFGAGRMLVAPAEMEPGFQEYLAEQFFDILSSDGAAKQFEKVGAPLDPAGMEEARARYQTAFKELPAALPAGSGG